MVPPHFFARPPLGPSTLKILAPPLRLALFKEGGAGRVKGGEAGRVKGGAERKRQFVDNTATRCSTTQTTMYVNAPTAA